jgi:glyoxylase-like metal-dependent hydrolase (beta-lactamase superfamily II)
LLKQYDLGCRFHAFSLIADEATGTAVIVAPQSNIDQYLAEAQTHGWQVRYVFLTHFHTDFLTGHLELHERIGATLCLGIQAQADDAFTPFWAGETQSVEGPCVPAKYWDINFCTGFLLLPWWEKVGMGGKAWPGVWIATTLHLHPCPPPSRGRVKNFCPST